MKGLVATVAVATAFLCIGGVACGQNYYGAYGNQYQQYYGQFDQGQSGYGQYGQAQADYGQYGQAYGGYNQYGQPQQGYGQNQVPYGQQQYMPRQQGQGGYDAYSYGGYPGYSDYSGPGQYGYQQGYGAGTGYSQQPARRRQARQPAQARTITPQSPRTTVTEQSVGRTQSMQSSQTSRRESSSIYWDGRETIDDDMGGAPMQAPQAVQQPMQPGTRQAARPTTGSVIQPARRIPQNAIRQNTASVPAAPPRKNMRWGKQEESSAAIEKPESKRALTTTAEEGGVQTRSGAMKWGKQDRPNMVGSEPGVSSQSAGALGRSDAVTQESAESRPSAKRFEWGQNR